MRSQASIEKNRVLSREAKRRAQGTCEACGGPTRYNGHGIRVSRLCRACGSAKGGQTLREQLLGKGPLELRALAYLDGGERRFMEIARDLGISTDHVSNLMWRLVHYGLVERVGRGRYRRVAA